MKFSCTTRNSILVIIFVFAFMSDISAQVSSLSPYSRFGIGLLVPQNNPMTIGLSGATTAWYDPLSVNPQNPASYASSFSTSFDVGIKGSLLQLKNSTEEQNLNSSTINNLSMVFKKIGSQWAFGTGVTPYTTTGYSITDSQTIEDVGEVNFTFDGQGGVNKAFVGAAYSFILKSEKPLLGKKSTEDTSKVTHHLSLGTNMNFTFGSIEQVRRILYADPTYDHFRISSSTSVRDLSFDFGVHSRLKLTDVDNSKHARTVRLNIGAVYSLGQDINSSFEEVSETINITGGTEFVLDTVSFISDPDGIISIPSKIALGLALELTNQRNSKERKKKRSFLFAVDFKQQDWSNYSVNAGGVNVGGTLANATDLAFGFQYTPRLVDAKNALQRTNYRLGFRTTNSYLVVNDRQIEEIAVTAGLSSILGGSGSFSKMNLGIEFGTRGTTEMNLVEENFINVFLGFTFVPSLRNRWFVQRKYD